MSCKFNGRENPRVVIDRHNDDCRSESCKGCQTCTELHCRVCGITHGLGACPECLGAARDDLRNIGVLCDALPEEVMHRGIDGEAMTLLGPACDPEARGHLEASVMAGRVSADYLDDAGGEHHPKFVVSSWDLVWRDALEHDEADAWTLMVGIDYLDRQMTYMATFEHVPFEDFARDVRQCVAHLEQVLHDGEQVDTGAPCLNDGVRLVREWGKLAAADGWRCPKCKTFSDESQYRLAVKAEHMAQADWLTANDCADWLEEIAVERAAVIVEVLAAHGIKSLPFTEGLCLCGYDDDVHASSILDAHQRHVERMIADLDAPPLKATPSTIRAWAAKDKVHKRRDAGRTLYRKDEVLALAESVAAKKAA